VLKPGLRSADWVCMARIKAECPGCGPVRMRPDSVVLRVCRDDGVVTYRFVCPTCDEIVDHAAGPRVYGLLQEVGVRTEVWSWPAELNERPDGPPFTHDDLLDFHQLLAGDDWRQALTERPTT
jgi:hypothetical protein